MAVNDGALAQEQKGMGAMFGETWVAFPDDVPLRAKHPGDTRAAFVPWLAHQVRLSAHSNMPAVAPSIYRTYAAFVPSLAHRLPSGEVASHSIMAAEQPEYRCAASSTAWPF